MFEIKKREPIKIKVYDIEYSVKRPSVGAYEIMQSKMNVAGANTVTIMREFLHDLGMPLEVLTDLEVDEFNLLVEYIISSAKKN